MIPAIAYNGIYLGIISILTLIQCQKYSQRPYFYFQQKYQQPIIPTLILTISIILFIGLRPINSVFVDMVNYNDYYHIILGNPYHFNANTSNILFDNLFSWMAGLNIDITFFFLIIATIYFGGIGIACRKLFPKDTFYAILIYLAALSTFSYGTNGIKAGAAASLFLIAIAYHKQWLIALVALLLSYGFHHSMQLPIAAYMVVTIIRQPKYYLVFWILSLVLAAAHITFFQDLFANMTDEQGAGYLQSKGTNWGGKEGFRLDFVLYSVAPIAVGYYAIFKHRINSQLYNFIYGVYLFTNSIWMLCMYANFNNRIAYLSWFLLPIVLIYPFMNEQISRNQYKTLNYIAFGHLAFTLFMVIIYY